MENFDKLKRELQIYIDKNFVEEANEKFAGIEKKYLSEEKIGNEESKPCYSSATRKKENKFYCARISYSEKSCFYSFFGGDEIDFKKIQDEQAEETFSEKLIRLIEESGEKNSVIYNRANIDRRHFSKICNHKNYQPSKLTAAAFAIALKLNFEQTQELLAAAGYTLTKNNLADIIISFFIEKKIFDVDLVNDYLYDYKQPLLGG